jgi:uncharacterized protein YecE (DUF72 family)
MPRRVLVGTSGYNYPEWRGSFYPEKLPTNRMLGYYAERFSTVEINYTFYRMPTDRLLAGWSAGTPEAFCFTLKAPRRITHDAKLQHTEDLLHAFCRTARTLGPKLGVLLFQLPPSFRKNLDVLRQFVEAMPDDTRAAFEFRHASWFDEDVYDVLRARNLALCVADSEKLHTPVETTADYAYFRLRDEGYEQADLDRWADTIGRLSAVSETYVYFKHEEQGLGAGVRRAAARCAGRGGHVRGEGKREKGKGRRREAWEPGSGWPVTPFRVPLCVDHDGGENRDELVRFLNQRFGRRSALNAARADEAQPELASRHSFNAMLFLLTKSALDWPASASRGWHQPIRPNGRAGLPAGS